ncbi:choice-of-anchor G family protein [Arthrobacter sp. ISL-95]|uniref:choice-of-anchor G family protein n=1 Tax=Arthrobacter sp. ISL-95 TaxID=2819116 RepID=UPI001BEC4C4A|nr:choice-of-anchor G family protein [Arthrobacter sp. ISL-95]MBT2584954.1 choice-of-anchor G family protein [Arthrobacter sp. ISL-95]
MKARHFFRRVLDRPRRFVLVAAAAAITLAATTSVTTAAWTDNEWVRSAVGVSSPGDCSTNTMFTNKSWARQLQGTVLNTNLDTVAGVQGLTVVNNGAAATPTPLSAVLVPGTTDAFVTKIPVSVLGSSPISAGLGLGLPVGGVGTYTQWARSGNSGQAHGASGLVSDQTGAVDVAGTAQGAVTVPKSASISLGNIVPASLAGVTLDVGAVASSSQLDGCDMTNGWPTLDPAPEVQRQYGIAGLDLNAAIPAVGTLSTQGASLVGAVPTQLNAVLGTGGLTTGISNGISALINPVLGTLQLGSISTTATLSAPNLTGVTALMTESITDGIVTINLGTGTVKVDIASLAGSTLGLNGMEPNHAVVLDAGTTTAVTNRVTALLDSWKNRVLTALTTALRSITLNATTNITLKLAGLNVAAIGVKIGPSTLGQFLDGTAVAPVVTADVLGLDLGGAVAALLTPITSILLTGTNNVVRNVLNATIFNTGLVANLGTSLQLLITPVINAVGPVLTAVRTLVAINVNVQPDQSWPGTKPADVTAATGEYKVSAIRVGLVDSAGLLSLQLGSSSAGPVALAVP